jgi:hypothetical protein
MPFRGAVTPLMSSLASSLLGSELTLAAPVPLTGPCRAGACSVIPLRALNKALTLVESCAVRVIHSWCASDAGGTGGTHVGAGYLRHPECFNPQVRAIGTKQAYARVASVSPGLESVTRYCDIWFSFNRIIPAIAQVLFN